MSNLLSLASKMAVPGAETLPPVERWNPAYCGEIDMVIRRDGLWLHEGSPIGRPHLVRLFSTVLKREGDDYFLVTPVEKLAIRVEDVPFLAVAMEVEGTGEAQKIRFRTNVGDQVTAGPDHPLRFRREVVGTDETLVPYVEVRAGLEARLSRPVYYDFVDLIEGDPPAVASDGAAFPLEAEPGKGARQS